MLNSYKEGCLMNESHVFYAATSTFRNTLLEPPPMGELQEASAKAQQGDACAKNDLDCGRSPNSRRQPAELGPARWQEFCDNLSLSIRGRLFIMESNFKRRLRALRKYLHERLPKRSSAAAQHPRHLTSQARAAASYFQEAKLSRHRLRKLGRFHFPEPNSAKTLDAQQECLLNRLKRIKRERLFKLDTQQDEPEEGQSDTSGGGGDDDPAGQDEEVRDSDEPASISRLSRRRTNDLSGSCTSSSLSTTPPPHHQEGRPTGPNFGAPILIEAARPTHEDDEEQLAASSGAHSAARAGKSKPAGKRSRWISRSGRHIRDTALAFASSKKSSCIVCYERPPNIVTLPCKHSDICSDCFIEIIYMAVKHSQYPLRCVLCRAKVERIRCSRRLLLSVIERNRGLR